MAQLNQQKAQSAAKYLTSVVTMASECMVPEYTKQRGKDWIYNGKKNDYPDYLIGLFRRSSKHRAIVTGKVDLTIGNGWEPKDKNDSKAIDFIKAPNGKENLRELTSKIALDLEIFGGYYLEVTRKKAGEGYVIQHIPYNRMRTNEEETEFYYTKKWKYNPERNEDWKVLPAFDPANKQQKTGVFYYHEYSPSDSEYPVYPEPEYIGSIAHIEVDYEIGNFHKNNIKQSFWGSFLINYYNGIPKVEEQKKIEKKIKEKFTGTDNAGKFILNWAPEKDKGAELQALQPNEMDKLFDLLNKMIQQEIFNGHKVTSPMLFGIRVEGQLGGRNEMIEAWETFKASYIVNKQRVIEDTFNYLLTGNRFERVIKLLEKPPITAKLDMATIAAKMTDDEIRKEAGLAPIDKTKTGSDETINKLNTMSPLLSTKVLESMSQEQILALVGLTPQGPAALPHTPVSTPMRVAMKREFTEEDDDVLLSHFLSCGTSIDDYDIHKVRPLWFTSPHVWREQCAIGEAHLMKHCFATPLSGTIVDLGPAILKILDKTPNASYDSIAKQLKVNAERVKSNITDLIDAGLLDRQGGMLVITPAGDKAIPPISSAITEITVMYQYDLNPALPGPAVIPTTRKFCREMINAKRLYTPTEIQAIAAKMDYDVWLFRGGWYHNPQTGETTEYCRHIWKQVVVTKKRAA